MEQILDLFVEHHYFKFQKEIQFFSIQQWNTETSWFRKLLWLQVSHHITCMTGLC